MKAQPFTVIDDPVTTISEDQIQAVLEWSEKNSHLFSNISTERTSPDWAKEFNMGDE